MIAEDLQQLGLSYDLFTRTTTTQPLRRGAGDVHSACCTNGYVFPQTHAAARSARRTGRTLPDRYIEGTCPICGYPHARGDQCDNCGNQLDPTDLIEPQLAGSTARRRLFVETEHYFLDLPAPSPACWATGCRHADALAAERAPVLPEPARRPAAARDHRETSTGACRYRSTAGADRPDKRLYVWFDAVIGYLSASDRVGGADRRPGRVATVLAGARTLGATTSWARTTSSSTAEIWPAILFGYSGPGDRGGNPGRYGALERAVLRWCPASSCTMEGRKFLLVAQRGDLRARHAVPLRPDALRYYLAAAGPETQDTDFTWAEFLRRNNDELVAGWGNLVNRTIAMTAKNLGAIPAAGALADADQALLATTRTAFDTVGDLLSRSRQRAAIIEAMRVVGRRTSTCRRLRPGSCRTEDPDRMATVLHVALQAVDDCKTLLTPFLPSSSSRVHAQLGGTGTWAGMPDLVPGENRIVAGDAADSSYSVLTGDYETAARWESTPIEVGRPIAPPTPVFTKLDPSIVDEELARLEAGS